MGSVNNTRGKAMKKKFFLFVLLTWGMNACAADAAQLIAAAGHRENCSKKESISESEVADCIERGVYDPCDDAGGTWGRTMCAFAHKEVAERRLAKAEREIITRLKEAKAENGLKVNFLSVQQTWRNYRESYCQFTSSINNHDKYFDSSSRTLYGFCARRLTEERVKELELILEK